MHYVDQTFTNQQFRLLDLEHKIFNFVILLEVVRKTSFLTH